MADSLSQKTIHSLKWSYFSVITTSVLQIVYTVVMSRLLNPPEFGLVAMGNLILNFGNYFAKMGLGSALVQKSELLKEEIRAVFISSVFLGIVFFLFFILLAPLSQLIFHDASLIPILRVMSLSFIISALSITSLGLLRRELLFKKIAQLEVISYIIGYLFVGIGMALLKYGVWSLIVASLTQTLIVALIAFIATRHSLKPIFEWKYYSSMFSFGSKVSIISFLEFIGLNLDSLFIGRYFGAVRLGIYNRSSMIINLPFNYIATSFSRVLIPTFSRVQNDDEKFKTNLIIILGIAVYIFLPCAIIVSFLGKEIITILLGEKWLAGLPILRIIAFSASFEFIASFIAGAFEAKALLKPKLIIQFTSVVLLILFFRFLLPFELIGFALSLLIMNVTKLILYTLVLKQKMKIQLNEFNIFLAPGLFAIILSPIVGLIYLLLKDVLVLNVYFSAALTILLWLYIMYIVYRSKYSGFIRNFIQSKIQFNSNYIKRILFVN